MEALVLRDSINGSPTDREFLKFCLENSGLRIAEKLVEGLNWTLRYFNNKNRS